MSSFGKLFKITTFGESHGVGVGCIIENMPPQIKITNSDIQYQLNRRKPNQNSLLTTRNEPDIVEIYSGIQNEITLGTPICLVVKNIDMKPEDYKKFSNIPRPGHADLTYLSKYGVKSTSGGGRASARETVARVAAGAVAEKYLNTKFNTEIVSWVNSVSEYEIPKSEINEIVAMIGKGKITKKEIDLMGTFSLFNLIDKDDSGEEKILFNIYFKRIFRIKNIKEIDVEELTLNIEKIKFICKEEFPIPEKIIIEEKIYNYIEEINIRCPHPQTAVKMINLIMRIKSEGDSVGGTVSCIIRDCPRSLGEPSFDKFEAELAKAMLSIPATKGFEIGSGFEGTKMKYNK
jgi:chorismate synthase